MQKLEDLSKEELIKRLRLAVDLAIAVDGLWFLAAEEAQEFESAPAMDVKVWERYAPLSVKRIRKRFNLLSKGLEAIKEVMGYDPFYSPMKFEFNQDGPDRLILQVNSCPGLETQERMGREIMTCEAMEIAYMTKLAETIDPKIQVKPLKLPPRSSPDEICCSWLFSHEKEG